MAVASVPVVDLTAARSGDRRARVTTAAALDAACRASGFFAVTGTGVDPGLIDEMRSVGRAFFGLTYEEKLQVAPTDGVSHRGYLGVDATALASTLGEVTPPDLSEAFNIGNYETEVTTGDDEAARRAGCWPNRWPPRPSGLRPAFERYFAAMRSLAVDVLGLLALALDLPERFFTPPFARHNTSMLLMNYYPALREPPRPGQLRRGAHTDYGIITVLYAEGEPGLQIWLDDEWQDVPAVADGFVVNLGDLMARWVNDRWRSTLHRVVVPPGREHVDRISMPFFVHPDFDTVIETVPSTVTTGAPARYEPVVAGRWIAAKSQSMKETADS